MIGAGGTGGAAQAHATAATGQEDKVRRLAEFLPRPLRFLGVGGLGLLCDLAVFTAVNAQLPQPLVARLVSLAVATLVTWRLNRALTFDRSFRHPAEEAARYAAVTAAAQGTSYTVFAALVLTVLAAAPQVALVTGAAAGALISYTGHRLFAFAPRAPSRPLGDTKFCAERVLSHDR
jgi:putative flippase GtrA